MKHKLVALALALGVYVALASPAWALPDAVRVVYAQPFSYAAGGFSWSESYIYVHTKNLGTPASRHVYLHYRNGSVWNDTELTLIGVFSDHSTYRVTHTSPTVEFAIKYVTSAGTYWDNNNGANYKIQPYLSSGGYLAGHVGYDVGLTSSAVSDYAYFTGTGWSSAAKLTVDVAVNNLSYNKQVGIRYTTNGGATWQDANGAYGYSVNTGGGSRIEYWRTEVYGLPLGGSIRFAVFYKNLDWSTEYWDNNFTQDYTQPLVAGNQMN